MESGRNWSGNERNVAFLNTGDGKFAGVSALLGFDSPADGRGMVLVDWDGDGDQDVWLTQRTAPRLRFLRNDNHSKGNAVHIKLNTPQGPSQAIGARVTLTDSQGTQQTRTLRTGEGYLSQFSQSLHFGLGQSQTARKIQIRWPDGNMDTINGVSKGHWLADKGKSALRPIKRPSSQLAVLPGDSSKETNASTRRLIPHSPLKLPLIPTMESTGDPTHVKVNGKRQLLVFWATWCSPCVQELNELNQHRKTLSDDGLEILALNVDDIKQPAGARSTKVKKMFRRHAWELNSALATRNTLELVDAAREVILGRQWAWSIPCSMLLDEQGDLIAIYEGSPSIEQLNKDARTLFKSGTDRSHAVPYEGHWYLAHYPADLLALGEVLLEKGLFSSLEDYMTELRDLKLAQPEKAAFIARQAGMEIARTQMHLGIQLLDHAVHFEPENTEHLYARAVLKQSSKQYLMAINDYELIINRQPNHTRAKAALAWLLSAAPDETLRNPAKAIQLAKSVCDQTEHQAPEALDVLATAFAASGNYYAAIEAAERALSLLPEEARQNSPINSRLISFKHGKPFFLSK